MKKIWFVTGNANKFRELSVIASKYNVTFEMAPLKGIEPQADSLEFIASFCAEEASKTLGEPLVVEDSGLFIDALKGFPGVYSSYVYKTIGCEGILKLMKDVSNRRAFFKAVVAYWSPELPEVKLFTGICQGRISDSIRGSQGFGFDPIFIPESREETFAQMSREEKSLYSHRYLAFSSFLQWLCSDNRKL